MPSPSSWLKARIGAPRRERVLLLCRTRATAVSARVALAAEGGRLGVEVATPAGLAAQVAGPALGDPLAAAPAAELPAGSAMAARVGPRPGLAAAAWRHTAAWRSARALAGDPSGAPAWLDELVRLGWAEDDEQRARARLLERARRGGLTLGAGIGWDRVVPIGFDVAPALVEPWVRALLEAFGQAVAPAPAPPAPLEALEVPDVLAEARLAVDRAREDPAGTLVLVADEATAGRVRDALRRNGLGCTWRAAVPLVAHPVAPALRRSLDWCAAVDPPIRAADLCAVLARLRRLPEAGRACVRARVGALGHDPDEARRRAWPLVEVVERARLPSAPLSRWIERLGEVAEEGGAGAAATALAARARLELLREALGERGPGLGALRRWFLDVGPPAADPTLAALLSRWAARADAPATPGHLAELLGGSVDDGPAREGVQVMHVDDYDGRPASQLVLLDVHDRGIGRRAPPDPLLDDEALRAVGLPTPSDLAAHRVDQLHRAVAAAGRAVAVLTRRDASGREVVPPLQLDLRRRDGPAGSHGLRLPLPERERLRALEPREGAPSPPRSGDAALDHLATQATAEWYREGRGHLPAPGRAPAATEPLAARLSALGPAAPAWLLPWLGHAEIPEAALPPRDEGWSEDELFRPLTHCLYQAWLRAVIRPRIPRAPRQRLDARAVGRAARAALAEIAPSARWRVDRGEQAAAVEDLARALDRATPRALARALEEEPLSAARRASAEGHARRWAAHWRRWAAQAVRPRRRVVTADDLAGLLQHPAHHHAREALLASVGDADRAPRWVVDDWLGLVADARARGDDPRAWPDAELLRHGERAALPASWAEAARRFLERTELDRLVALRRGARQAAGVLVGDTLAVAADLPFGADPPTTGGGPALGRVALRLGEGEVAVRGRVDRVDVIEGPEGPLLHVVAWTPGAEAPDPRRAAAAVWSGSEPGLLLQALALREAGWPAGARVAAVGWEPLGAVEPRRRGPAAVLLDDAGLEAAAAHLGRLVDAARAGRWTLHPRPDTCPSVARWGHDGCPYADACRLRGLPEGTS